MEVGTTENEKPQHGRLYDRETDLIDKEAARHEKNFLEAGDEANQDKKYVVAIQNYQQAASFLKKRIDISKQGEQPLLKEVLTYHLSLLHLKISDSYYKDNIDKAQVTPDALKYVQKAYQLIKSLHFRRPLAEKLQYDESLKEICILMSKVLRTTNKPPLLREAIVFLKESIDIKECTDSYWNMGKIYEHLHNYTDGLIAYQKGLALTPGDRYKSLADFHGMIAFMLGNLQRPEDALCQYYKSLEIMTAHKLPNKARIYLHMGLLFHEKNPKKAIEFLTTALSFRSDFSDSNWIVESNIYHLWSNCNVFMGHYPEALENLYKAASIYKKNPPPQLGLDISLKINQDIKKLRLLVQPQQAAKAAQTALVRHTSEMACATCQRTGVKLLLCSQCFSVRYCSIECQKMDWAAAHKPRCLAIVKEKKAQEQREKELLQQQQQQEEDNDADPTND